MAECKHDGGVYLTAWEGHRCNLCGATLTNEQVLAAAHAAESAAIAREIPECDDDLKR